RRSRPWDQDAPPGGRSQLLAQTTAHPARDISTTGEYRQGRSDFSLPPPHHRQDRGRPGLLLLLPPGDRPKVIGMGILVDDLEMVTCAHVVDAAIGEGWFDQPGDGVVRVCFPFVAGLVCVNGTVDRKRYFRQDRAEEGKLTDIAVVVLSNPAPPEVGRVVLRGHVNDASVMVFGFRQKELETGG